MPEVNPYARFLDHRPLLEILAATPITLESLLQAIPPEQITALACARANGAPPKSSATSPTAKSPSPSACARPSQKTTTSSSPSIRTAGPQPIKASRPPKALATFTSLRRWNLTLARKALPAAADKPVTHPERGTMTFTTLLETMAGHDINHLRQLQTLAGFGS